MFDFDLDRDLNAIQPFTLEHGGVTLAAQRIAGRMTKGDPVFVWLSGYGSDMNGSKASWLTRQCQIWSLPFLKFDYRGCGQSGGAFNDATISDWVADAVFAIEQLTDGPVVLVGSSMGSWIALRVAAQCARVAALVLIAPAPDFTKRYWDSCSAADQAAWKESGTRQLSHSGLPVSYKLVTDANEKHLILDQPITFDGPVSLLHGMADDIVPYSVSQKILAQLTTQDVSLHLVKDGDHGLSRPDDLALVWQELTRVWDKVTESKMTNVIDEDAPDFTGSLLF